jgi:hypothetical protein
MFIEILKMWYVCHWRGVSMVKKALNWKGKDKDLSCHQIMNLFSKIYHNCFCHRDNKSAPSCAPENCGPMKETRQPSYTVESCTPEPKPQWTLLPNKYKIPFHIGPKIVNEQSVWLVLCKYICLTGGLFGSPALVMCDCQIITQNCA